MRRPQHLERFLTELIARAAGTAAIDPEAIRRQIEIERRSPRPLASEEKFLVRTAKNFRTDGKFGRLRSTLLIGAAYLDASFLTKCERAGALLPGEPAARKFGRFLKDLSSELEKSDYVQWRHLGRRVRTYQAYDRLLGNTAAVEQSAIRILRRKPRFVIKNILALVQLSFLRGYFGHEEVSAAFDFVATLGTPEEVSSIASALIAVANQQTPIDSYDLGAPWLAEPLDGDEVRVLMEFGGILVERHSIAKHISIFGYELEYRNGKQPVYYLAPPYPEFEYALRLGYIRKEINVGGWRVTGGPNAAALPSFLGAAEKFAQSWRSRLGKLMDADTPFERVRTNFPIVPKFYEALGNTAFFEDLVEYDSLVRDFILPPQGDLGKSFSITSTMSLDAFMRIWRILRFMCFVDIFTVQAYQNNTRAFRNSLVRVTKENEAVEMLAAVGIELDQAREFLGLIGADVHNLGYFDLQYRPLLRIAQNELGPGRQTTPPELIHVSALLGTTSALRNVQIANKVRLKEMPGIFVQAVAARLKTWFPQVVIDRKIKSPEYSTDVDVVVFASGVLYLFECKHSVFPTEPHEARDSWEDIEKGVEQLKVATKILEDPARMKAYLAAWFPELRQADDQPIPVKLCVLSSHRIFAGSEYQGVPVRDYASLSLLTEDGVLTIATGEGDETLVRRLRVTENGVFSSTELEDYLSSDSRYFRSFRPFTRPVCVRVKVGRIDIARETYVFDSELGEWLDYLESIGCERLPDERRKDLVPALLGQLMSPVEHADRE